MDPALPPLDDPARLAALHRLGLLDGPPQERFDRITATAARLTGLPASSLGLVDADRQWNLSLWGEGPRERTHERSLCARAVAHDELLVLDDVRADPAWDAVTGGSVGSYAGVPLHTEDGLPVGVLCVWSPEPHAFTEAQRAVLAALGEWAEAELRATEAEASEALLSSVLDGAPAAVLLVDDQGTVDWANVPARELLGADLPGRPVGDVLPTLQPRDLGATGRRDHDTGRATGRRTVHHGRRPDGSPFPAEVTLGPRGRRSVVFVRDLVSEQSERAQLAALRERTEVAFDVLAVGVVVLDGEGRFLAGNLAAARLVGRRRADLVGKHWHELLHGAPAGEVGPGCPPTGCPLTEPMTLAGRTVGPVTLARADGSTVQVELALRLVRDGDSAAGLVVTVQDLTERLQVERLKADFLSSVSHELRTPLTSIRGSLGLLSSGVVDAASDRGRRMLQIAAESTDRLARLVNDLLDLERLRAGRVELQLERHRVAALLTSAAHEVSGAAGAAGVLVDVRDTDLHVLADADRVVQVLVNLVGNAVKFSPAGSAVVLDAEADGSRVRVSVRDQGRGIPEDQLDRIFDRFSQVETGDSRQHGGTGLGLAIAKGLVEQHGGTLTATSELGRGSTFVLTLPAAPRRERLLAYAPADEVPEDLRALLGGSGWQLVAVPDVDRLSALAASGRPPSALLLAAGPQLDRGLVDAAAAAAAEAGLPLLALTRLGAPADLGTVPEPGPVQAHVLLVEDDDALAELLCTRLGDAGLDVDRASTQPEAVAHVRARRPDAVVLDLLLAVGSGFGVVEELRASGDATGLPVLVYSVLDLDETERARLQTGSTTFLQKGRVGVDEVLHDVVRLLQAAAGGGGRP